MSDSHEIQTNQNEDLEHFSFDDRIKEQLVPSYWKNLGHIQSGAYGRCKEQIRPSSRNTLLRHEQGTMPEHILMFETIWMLEGFRDSCIYQWKNESYSLVPNVKLVNVDHAVLQEMLQPFASHGTMLRTLYVYVKNTQQKYDGACVDGRTSALLEFVLCVEAFCGKFRDFLGKLRSNLNDSLAKGKPYGILHFLQEFRSIFRDLNFIYDVFCKAVAKNGSVDECCRFSEHVLLDVIRSKFEEIWLTNDKNYGKSVWKILFLVCRRHGDLQYLSYTNMSQNGMYRDLVKHIALCVEENSVVILHKDEMLLPTPSKNWPEKMNPLLSLHLAAVFRS